MRLWIGFFGLLLSLFFTPLYAADKVIVLDIDGIIGPATQDYIERGLEVANKQEAKLVVIRLNTPGGLESSMRNINQAILSSPLPVVTYVTPSGARAASAGTFILYASHLAAMAPGTHVGAASPVSIAMPTTPADEKKTSTLETKATNDAAAYIRSLAQFRGRNADWADQAVRHAASLTADNAKKLNVIDEIATDLPQLLNKIDGRIVVVSGNPSHIQSKNLTTEIIPTNSG